MVIYDPIRHVPDLNHWEGNISPGPFFDAGPRKLITKLTDGYNFGDPGGHFLIRHALERGLPVETYHFPRPLDDTVAQIIRYRDALYGAYLTPQTSKTWFDFEAKGLPLAWRALSLLRIRTLYRPWFLKTLRTAVLILGTVPGVYTGMSFLNSYVGRVDWEAEGLNEPDLWASDFGWDHEGNDYTGKPLDGPRYMDLKTWRRPWVRHQITDRGRMPGVPGAVDLNIERE